MTQRKVKNKETAIENVKRLFSNAPKDDSIFIKEAFEAWGRPDPDDMEANKAWLSNMLFHLKYHNLLKPVYSFSSGRKKLDRLQLTLEGKKILGRIEGEHKSDSNNNVLPKKSEEPLSFNDVMKIVANLRKDNPEYDITFDIKLKGRE